MSIQNTFNDVADAADSFDDEVEETENTVKYGFKIGFPNLFSHARAGPSPGSGPSLPHLFRFVLFCFVFEIIGLVCSCASSAQKRLARRRPASAARAPRRRKRPPSLPLLRAGPSGYKNTEYPPAASEQACGKMRMLSLSPLVAGETRPAGIPS